jgi:cytochrome c oxidase subunit III
MSTLSFYKTPEEIKLKEKTAKWMLWLSMVSMTMIFAGLTSAYVVRQGAGSWLEFQLPKIFYISSAIILISSASMNWAMAAARKSNFKNVLRALAITLALGIAFVYSQFAAWGVLVDEKIFFTGKTANASGSFLYILTGLHLAHLFGGIIYLAVVLARSLSNRYHAGNLMGLKLCAIFWHFLDALWIYLFLFFLFIR